MNLTVFLLARIAEDVERADLVHEVYGPDDFAPMRDRILAECDAKVWIVEGMRPFGPIDDINAAEVLGHLASVYADHPDYNEAWRV